MSLNFSFNILLSLGENSITKYRHTVILRSLLIFIILSSSFSCRPFSRELCKTTTIRMQHTSTMTWEKYLCMKLWSTYFAWKVRSQQCKWDIVNEEHDSYLKYDRCRKLTTSNSDCSQPGGWTGIIKFTQDTSRELRRRTQSPTSEHSDVRMCGISVRHLALSFWDIWILSIFI